MAPDTSTLIAAILNSGWLVRHYSRGGRMRADSSLALRRRQAIQALGIVVRDAFAKSNDFEPLLAAIVDALRPREEGPPF